MTSERSLGWYPNIILMFKCDFRIWWIKSYKWSFLAKSYNEFSGKIYPKHFIIQLSNKHEKPGNENCKRIQWFEVFGRAGWNHWLLYGLRRLDEITFSLSDEIDFTFYALTSRPLDRFQNFGVFWDAEIHSFPTRYFLSESNHGILLKWGGVFFPEKKTLIQNTGHQCL